MLKWLCVVMVKNMFRMNDHHSNFYDSNRMILFQSADKAAIGRKVCF